MVLAEDKIRSLVFLAAKDGYILYKGDKFYIKDKWSPRYIEFEYPISLSNTDIVQLKLGQWIEEAKKHFELLEN